MDVEEFERLLRIWHGRAVLYLRDHDAAPYRDAILHACLHDLRFDSQLEASRAVYLLDLIARTGDEAFFRERILAALAETRDLEVAWQLVELARLLAERGDAAAHEALYAFVARVIATRPFEDRPLLAADALVALDGLDGFLFVAEQFERCSFDPRSTGDDGAYLVRDLQEKIGAEVANQALETISAANPRVVAFIALARGEEREEQGRSAARQRLDYRNMT